MKGTCPPGMCEPPLFITLPPRLYTQRKNHNTKSIVQLTNLRHEVVNMHGGRSTGVLSSSPEQVFPTTSNTLLHCCRNTQDNNLKFATAKAFSLLHQSHVVSSFPANTETPLHDNIVKSRVSFSYPILYCYMHTFFQSLLCLWTTQSYLSLSALCLGRRAWRRWKEVLFQLFFKIQSTTAT